MKKEIKLLTLDEVKNGVDMLLLDEAWTSLKAEENPKKFRERFNKVFGHHLKQVPYLIQLLNVGDIPFKIYRIRKVNQKFNEHLISTYGAPSSDVCTHYQRANIPHFPVFYGAENPGTAIAELLQQEQANNHDEYVLSEWSFRRNSQIRICPFIFSESETKWINEYALLTIHKIRNKVLQKYSVKEQDGFIEVLRFLSELFLYENSRPLTSHIAHLNLYANHSLRAEVFIYPSVQAGRKTVNFAIHPNCIHEKGRLENVYKIKIGNTNFKKGTSQISFLMAGENKDGIIHWFNIDEKGNSEHSGLRKILKQTKSIL